MDLSILLDSAGFGRYAASFEAEGIDLETFGMMSAADLVELGVEAVDQVVMLHLVHQIQGSTAPATPADPEVPGSALPGPLPAPMTVHPASAGAPPMEASDPLAHLVAQMVDLGLGRIESTAALAACDGDLTAAVDYCLVHGNELAAFEAEEQRRSAASSAPAAPAATRAPTPHAAPRAGPPAVPAVAPAHHLRGPWASHSVAAAPWHPGQACDRASVSAADSAADPAAGSAAGSGFWSTVASQRVVRAQGQAQGRFPRAVTDAEHQAAVARFVQSCGFGGGSSGGDGGGGGGACPVDQKVVVVLRGIPGCGKSTLTAKVSEAAAAGGRRVVVCSADSVRPCASFYASWFHCHITQPITTFPGTWSP